MSDTPVTDAFREVVFTQYKEDELTGDGMGNILAALTDIETLERERDESRQEMAKWHQMSIEADKRFVEAVLVRDEESKKSRRELDAERALADRLAGTLSDLWRNGAEYEAVEGALAAWKEARSECR